jgi:hypothetical protein
MVKVKIDIGSVESAAIAAFKDACYFAHAEMIKTISDPGAFEDFPGQDIVDTGNLRASQQPPEFSENGTKATFRNTAEYADIIHNGATFEAGKTWDVKAHTRTIDKAFGKTIPKTEYTVSARSVTREEARELAARPWMDDTLERIDIAQVTEKLMKVRI